MDPVTLMMLMGVVQTGVGLYQSLTNRKPEAPTYDIPFSQRAYMQEAAGGLVRIKTRLPGQDIAESNIRSATASGIGRIQRTGGTQSQALDAATKLAMNEQEAFKGLSMQAAQYAQSQEEMARQRYMDALRSQTQQEEQQFQYNQMMPYSQELQDYQARRQSGFSNVMGGINTMGSTYISNKYQQQMGQWMNQGGGQSGNNQIVPQNTRAGFDSFGYEVGDTTPFGKYVSNTPYLDDGMGYVDPVKAGTLPMLNQPLMGYWDMKYNSNRGF